jgi:hypothetical protein
MAIIKKGILGGVSGKVGNVVGGSWKGIEFIRSLPSGGNSSNSVAQQMQRLKFGTVMRFLRIISGVIRIGYKPFATKMSSYNAAFSYHYHNALSGAYPDFVIDYSKVVVTRGYLPGSKQVSCSSPRAGEIQITWDSDTSVGVSSPSDVVTLVLINDDKQEAIHLLDASTRIEGTTLVAVPSSYSGDKVHCYLAIRTAASMLTSSSDKNDFSTSQYVGMVTVL